MICGYGSCSIDGIVSNADSFDWQNTVFSVGSLGLRPVVCCVFSAVCVVPGVVCDNSVPEGVGCSTVSKNGSHEASCKVGFKCSLTEINIDKVLSFVVVFEVEAF